MEASEIFTRLYNTDIYAANRLLLDFDQDTIDELQRSGKYPNLFTESLQTDLYRRRLVKMKTLDEALINQLISLHKQDGIPYSKIYRITEIVEDGSIPIENLLMKISERDDPDAIKILRIITDLRDLMNGFIRGSPDRIIYEFVKNKSKKVIRYLLDNNIISENSFDSITEEIASWNDIDFIRYYAPKAIDQLTVMFNGDRDRAKRMIHGLLLGGASVGVGAPNVILYLVERGHHLNDEDMAFIAHNPATKHLIPVLLQRGADPVNPIWYEAEFGEEYHE